MTREEVPRYTQVTGVPVTSVRSAAALKALTHPLRLELLSLLRRHGPATASALGRRVGETSGVTSYHLRQLARYGFVELDPEQPNRRDRVWRARAEATDVTPSALGDDPAALVALDRLIGVQLDDLRARTATFLRAPAAERHRWEDASASSDARLRLTPTMLAELRDEILAVVAAWRRRGEQLSPEDPETREVGLYLSAVPELTEDDRGRR